MTDEDLEQLREQSQRGTRLEDEDDQDDDLVDELVEALAAIERGDTRKTIAVRDQPIAALLTVLDENDDAMAEVGHALQAALDREPGGEFDRSELVRLAVRVGLQEAAPATLEELEDAHAEHMKNQL